VAVGNGVRVGTGVALEQPVISMIINRIIALVFTDIFSMTSVRAGTVNRII
jgi:hypothetical protein